MIGRNVMYPMDELGVGVDVEILLVLQGHLVEEAVLGLHTKQKQNKKPVTKRSDYDDEDAREIRTSSPLRSLLLTLGVQGSSSPEIMVMVSWT